MVKNYVSIDIGGTAIKYGVIAADGKILTKIRWIQKQRRVDQRF